MAAITNLCLLVILLQGFACVLGGGFFYGKHPPRRPGPTEPVTTEAPEPEEDCRKLVIVKDGETKVEGPDGQAATITSVTLLGEISYGACFEWITYFYETDTFLVSGGCKGAFQICYSYESTSPVTEKPIDPGCKTVILRSTGNSVDTQTVTNINGDPADVISMELIKDLGGKPCIEWQTFFFHGSRVVAKFGCQGRFRVCYEVPDGQVGQLSEAPPPGCTFIQLLSRLNRRVTKAAPGKVDRMSVSKEFSNGICQDEESYGFNGNVVFARGGCRARFTVCIENSVTDEPRPEIPGCAYVKVFSRVNQPASQEVRDENDRPVLITSVKLIQQLSGDDLPCVKGQTFTFSGSKVIATDGCRAVILACYKPIHPGYGGYGIFPGHPGFVDK